MKTVMSGALAFGLISLSTPVAAQSISYDYDLTGFLDYALQVDALPVARFDSSLGTLTGVTLQLDASAGGDILVHCFFSSACTKPFHSAVIGTLALGGLNLTTTALSTQTFSFDPGTSTRDLPTVLSTNSIAGSSPAVLASFTGSGSTIGSLTSRGTAGCGAVAPAFACDAGVGYYGAGRQDQSLRLRVIYDYAVTGAVPEPATWAMLILGFGVIGGAIRRRSATVKFSRNKQTYA